MLQDFRHGLRLLLQTKGWSAVIILSLAVGIGANTVIFSAVNGLVFKSLLVPKPAELVRFRYSGANDMATDLSDIGASSANGAGGPVRAAFSYAAVQAFQKNQGNLSEVIASAPLGRLNVVVDGDAEQASG